MSEKTERISFAIGIPTINRYDLLGPFLVKYEDYFKAAPVFVMDNGKLVPIYGQTNVRVIRNPEPKGVAESWNALCRLIFIKHSHALILNDDILLNRNHQQVINFLVLHWEANFLVSQKGFCSFILPKKTYQMIGDFDENFKGAYFEDKDYERRLKLAKLDVLVHAFLNPDVFNESSSITKDKTLNNNYQANWEYYKSKWGGTIGGETFLTPFNK